MAPQGEEELFAEAGVFRAGGEAALVGEQVGLQLLDAAVAGRGVEGHGLAHHGSERVRDATTGKMTTKTPRRQGVRGFVPLGALASWW